MCDCLRILYKTEGFDSVVIQVNVTGTYGGRNYYEWVDSNTLDTYTIWWDSALSTWYMTDDGTGGTNPLAKLNEDVDCPTSIAWNVFGVSILESIKTSYCKTCGRENRFKETFTAIQLPKQFEAQDRGYKDCCCEQIILAGGNETWQNDVTSFWIKLSSESDTCTFNVVDSSENVVETYSGTQFPAEPNAYYQTVDWSQILTDHGVGCYYLSITYDIAGITGTLVWGLYKVKYYSIENALKTARVRAIFNGVQEIDQINFTGSNVESTHRFYGFIGNRQPNMEIDNIIYDNREMKRVIRENLNDYEIITDPLDECLIRPLTELYLISENELYISDYNAHNHSYRYLDLPVIVQESPDLEYFDFSRKARLKCKVGDKFKNQRTHY